MNEMEKMIWAAAFVAHQHRTLEGYDRCAEVADRAALNFRAHMNNGSRSLPKMEGWFHF